MTNRDQLRRRYERLLWAYPAWYRRERGTEMLTTLLDAADRHRPGWRDGLDLIAGGLRCRLRPPSPLAATLVIIAAVFVAILGSAAAVRGGLALVAPLPSEDEGIAIATAATGQRPHNQESGPVSCPYMCPVGWSREDQVVVLDHAFLANNGLDPVMVGYWPPAAQVRDMVSTAHTRLGAQGWRVSPLKLDGDVGGGFTATKDDVLIIMNGRVLSGGPNDLPLEPPVFLIAQRVQPAMVGPLSLIGLLVGGLIGWLLACWVTRRFRDQERARRAVALVAMGPALLMMLLTILAVAEFAPLAHQQDDPLTLVPALVLSGRFFSPAIIALSAIFLGMALVLAIVPSRGRSGRGRSERDNAGGPQLAA